MGGRKCAANRLSRGADADAGDRRRNVSGSSWLSTDPENLDSHDTPHYPCNDICTLNDFHFQLSFDFDFAFNDDVDSDFNVHDNEYH